MRQGGPLSGPASLALPYLFLRNKQGRLEHKWPVCLGYDRACAGVAELADGWALGSRDRKALQVQLLSPALEDVGGNSPCEAGAALVLTYALALKGRSGRASSNTARAHRLP